MGNYTSASSKKLITFEKIALVFGVLFAFSVFLEWKNVRFFYDEIGYTGAAKGILQEGFFSKYYGSDLRTYAYPLFLAVIQGGVRVFSRSIFESRSFIFVAHAILYFLAAFFLRSSMFSLGSAIFARICFSLLCINIFNLIYLSFALTETLSTVVLLVCLGLVSELSASNSLTSLKRSNRLLIYLGFFSGFSVMIRPANLFLIAGIVLFVGLFAIRSRDFVGKFLRLFAAILLVWSPQIITNKINYAIWTPLTSFSLAKLQMDGGRQFLKYATSAARGVSPSVPYLNPFPIEIGSELRMRKLALVSMIKVFALIDQDLMYPLNKSLTPWYRWPGTLLSLFLGGLGGISFVLYWREMVSRRPFWNFKLWSAPEIFFVATSAICIGSLALYSQTAVEARFGLSALVLLNIISAFYFVFRKSPWTRKIVWASSIFLCIWVFSGMFLSDWLQRQAPEIQKYRAENIR